MALLDPPSDATPETPEMAPKAAFSFGEQIAALMWCLMYALFIRIVFYKWILMQMCDSEVSDDAMARAVQGIPFLVRLFSHGEAPFSTKEAAGQCLLTLTEEFLEAQAQVPSDMLQSVIGRCGEEEETTPMALRVLSAGILANTIQDAASPFLPQIVQTVSACISQDWSAVLQKAADLSAKIELESSQSGNQLAEDTSNATAGIDLDAIKKSIDGKHAALQALESQTRYLQLSLEILSNLFCEEGLATGEQQDWEDADEDLDMDVDPSDGMTLDDDEDTSSPQLDSPCLSLLGPGLFASLTSLVSLSTPSGPALESLSAECATVKERTLGALTNILSSGSPSFWAANSSTFDWAHRLLTTLFSVGSPQVLASHVEALWALSRILPTNAIQPTMEQTQSLIHIFQHATTLSSEDVSASDIQTASVGILGYMGRTQGCVALNEVDEYCQ
jgi:hypothetical protein